MLVSVVPVQKRSNFLYFKYSFFGVYCSKVETPADGVLRFHFTNKQTKKKTSINIFLMASNSMVIEAKAKSARFISGLASV